MAYDVHAYDHNVGMPIIFITQGQTYRDKTTDCIVHMCFNMTCISNRYLFKLQKYLKVSLRSAVEVTPILAI